MAWNKGLKGKALSIAATECKYLRVMAGPGTGKTFAMKHRVARLLEEGSDPERLLVVTFTRVAAGSLVTELGELGVEGCDDIKAGTLHSFCFETLNREEVFQYLGRTARPLVTFSKSGALQFEAAPLVADISTEGQRKAAKRIRAFEAAWARLQSDKPGWPQKADDRQFHERLIAWLTFHQAMLIGELVPEILRYLRNNPLAPERSSFDHVIVDEYQDLNRADQVLLDLLTNENSVVIGDENQSIYRFRHAHPQGIVEFHKDHRPTHDEDLDECRRCPTRVVDLADNLIRHNHPEDAEPQLVPMKGNPEGEVYIVQWKSLEEEAVGIADYIQWLIEGPRGYEPGDILVLSPRRYLAYTVRDALVDRNVSAHSFYHEEALEDDEAQESFAYLTLLASPRDRVALRFLLGQGSSSWLKGQYKKLRAYCEKEDLSPRKALERIAAGKVQLPGVNKLVERYGKIRERLNELEELDTQELIDSLFPDGGKETRLLRDSALWMLNGKEKDEIKPDDLLARLRNLITQPEMPERAEFVRIMSLQKSKGLTSKVVIVLGCIEGLVPFVDPKESRAEKAEILREQRRLFYVAITRPTEILVLSSFVSIERKLAYKIGAVVRYGAGAHTPTIASRFLGELGPNIPASQSGRAWRDDGYE